MKKTSLNPYTFIKAWLDRTTMYVVVLAALGVLLLATLVLSFTGSLSVTPLSVVGSVVVLMLSAGLVSVICGLLFKVPAHHPSSMITALILFFLLSPAISLMEYGVLAGVAAIAVVSKYVLVYRKQHLVNAAAVAVFLIALSGYGAATWWIATPYMFVPLLLVGSAVVTKVRAWPMMLSFLLVGLLTFLFEEWRYGNNIFETWTTYFLTYPTLFLGFFMLTEPFTLPPTKSLRMGYGALVGFLSSTALFVPFFSMTPELALLIGNLVAYPYTLKRKLLLTFVAKRELGPLLYELTFTKPQGLHFAAGQYVEWMLPHAPTDARGIRRYFTILSAPTEAVVRLACKVPTPGSSYKQTLLALQPGDVITCSQLAGDFILPKNSQEKIAWVAGGIGVTPFVSQAQYLSDTKQNRDIVLLYAANSPAELVYQDELKAFSSLVPILANGELPGSESGFVTGDMITRRVPDFRNRTWYVSGPPGMVVATTKTLTALGVSESRIIRDFFPGLA